MVLNGTNAASLHAAEKMLFEDAGFDFSAGKTAITTATAAAIIAHADIAKLSFSLGTSAEKFGSSTFKSVGKWLSSISCKVELMFP